MASDANTTNRLFEEQLRTLRAAYVADLGRTLVQLEAFGEHLEHDHVDAETLAALQRAAHGLAGSGATYGFTTISEIAGRLDRYLVSFIETHLQPNDGQRSYALVLLADLHSVISNIPQQEQRPASNLAPPLMSTEPAQHIVICDADFVMAEDLAHQLVNFGYHVVVEPDPTELASSVARHVPAAIILDLALLEHVDLRAFRDTRPPIIFTSKQDDFVNRLRAVRSGGSAFFPKPIESSALVDTLDTLVSREEDNPYRILIIDDQPLLAATYATTLRQAGMLVSNVTNPLRVMTALSDFHPDVLLLDMYMPGCTGIELATVLRQQATFESIPIVFLSAETQIDRQMDALRRGGDDFLTKPIQLDHLVAAVASRAQRARKLRQAMTRDSLTGLYNHTTTKEHLKRELARASRQHHAVSFALIDLDHFKAVNDTYGHVVGDHVIKTLARLLKQRLRKWDIVGRYGGEEFALILPDTNEQTAYELLEELRERFACVRQNTRNFIFTSTFSCGIASFPEAASLASLITAADQALYQAKHAGRNQVAIAEGRTPSRSLSK